MSESEGRPDRKRERTRRGSPREGSAAAAARIQQQHSWVEQQIQQAIRRGDFDDLPGAGRPLEDLGAEHDTDWWLRRLVERERIVALPASVQMRKEDAELDDLLDRNGSEEQVRELVEGFNARVRSGRLHPEGPPFVTQLRDVEAEVERWRERRRLRYADQQTLPARDRDGGPTRRWWRWWRR